MHIRFALMVLAAAVFTQAQGPPSPGSPAKEYIRLRGKVVAIASRNVANVSVTVTPNCAGPSLTVDGSTYTSSTTLAWAVGSVHTVSTTATQAGSTGTQYLFGSWSDGGRLTPVPVNRNDPCNCGSMVGVLAPRRTRTRMTPFPHTPSLNGQAANRYGAHPFSRTLFPVD
jgi:hypothetical protein